MPTLAHLLIVSRYGNETKLVCASAQKYWGDIYISRKKNTEFPTDKSAPHTSINNNRSYNNIGDNIDSANIDSDFLMANHYEKFTHESQISDEERLQICIPNKGFCTYLHIPHLDISATKIRKLWAEQKCIKGLVAEPVQNLIEQHTPTLKKYW